MENTRMLSVSPGTPGRPVVYGKVGCTQGDLTTVSALQDYYGSNGNLIDAAHDEIPVTLVWLEPKKEYTETGKPYEQIARERGFSYRQVYEWVRKYRKFGIAGLEDRRGERKISQTPRSKEEELEKRIAELEHENHLLKLEYELRKKVEELERGNR